MLSGKLLVNRRSLKINWKSLPGTYIGGGCLARHERG